MDERFTNRGTIMKMVLSPGARIENRGTIMHLSADTLSDVTIVSYGTIMNTSGCHIINKSGALHTSGVKEIIREVPRQEDLQRIEELEKECARLRAQFRTIQGNSEPNDDDIHWGRKRIKQQRKTIDRLTTDNETLREKVKARDGFIERLEKEIERLRSREYVRHVENENENFRQSISYLNGVANDLRNEVSDLHEQLAATDRQQLLDTIEELQDKLKCAKNREMVLKHKAHDAELEAWKARQGIWDQNRPTKEQVKNYFKVIRNMMDVETDY